VRPGDAVEVKIGKGRMVGAFEREGTCSGADCGAAILWVRTPKGALMPVDPPDDAGDGAEPHWASCPNRGEF
jgi:hypothetical protein